MRVITGSAGGRKLKSPDGIRIRPTSDRIKESLFNILSFDIPGAVFLDLFGGTGAIGIEALSRGAEYAVFADSSSDACDIINFNLTHTKLAEKARVIQADYAVALNKLASENKSFDFIFVDPPYYAGLAKSASDKIKEYGMLKTDGFLIVEAASDEVIEFSNYHIYNEKKYGTTKIVILCE